MSTLKIEKITKVLKSDVFDASSNGKHVGRISYKDHHNAWGFDKLSDSQYLNQEECLEIHQKLKELNNANI